MNKKLFLSLALVSIILISCNPKSSKIERITKLEKELVASKMSKLDTTKAVQLIRLYDEFVKGFPTDSLAPIYLYRQADMNIALSRGTQAVVCLDKIITNYHSFNKLIECTFLKAFVAETVMHNLPLAEQYYREFLKKYPTHLLAKDAEVSLKNLGKSPEELVAEFEANQAKTDSLTTK